MKRYNAAAAEKTLAAYETSTDYERLHELARQGYKIPCFLWDNLHSEDTLFFRLAACKKIGNFVGNLIFNRNRINGNHAAIVEFQFYTAVIHVVGTRY